MSAISIHSLSKTYRGKRGAKVVALKNLDLEIEQGEVFGFLGPNGAGKSTTIKTLMGLIRPTSGSALIMGKDISSPEARRHVGFLPENPAFYDYLSAVEYLDFVGKTFNLNAHFLEEKIEEVLKLLELWDARKRPMRSYSKGMVQRVGLAQALLPDPDVYILDEPMSGLDPLGRALVKEMILKLKERGKAVFFSSHITSDMESVCDRVGIITQGELRSVASIDAIMTEGIMGYSVQSKTSGGVDRTETYVPKEELTSFLANLQRDGKEITLIEPRRKNLEQFFLDIIRTSSC
ncbi:MAG: ABC transporter ATP-binding protein [Geobacter sp.]|nr:MAG: ABC transporter ATP-binding protein [Geobacter sp.]